MLKAAFCLIALAWCHAKLDRKDEHSLNFAKVKANSHVAGPEEKARLKRMKEAQLKQEQMLEVITDADMLIYHVFLKTNQKDLE